MSDFRIDKITNRDGSAGTQIAGISTFSGTSGMVMPGGPTEYRGGRGRGIIVGGRTEPSSTETNILSYIEISTTGNSIDWGDYISTIRSPGNCASTTRGVMMGGYNPSDSPNYVQKIGYVTISSKGGASNFGDLTQRRGWTGSCNNETRGCNAGDWGTQSNTIDFITIATTGDASNFGDLTLGRQCTSCTQSPTRGIWSGGATGPSPAVVAYNIIDYITIATTGNATDFGDTQVGAYGKTSTSSGTRAVIAEGNAYPAGNVNTISYVEIASTGNAADFGDLIAAIAYMGSCSSKTRGVINGGGGTNVIQYITFASTGNSIDFGDMTHACEQTSALSDSNGGLV